MTLREYITRELHTSHDGTYDGVRRSMASPHLLARAFPTNPTVHVDAFGNVVTITIGRKDR